MATPTRIYVVTGPTNSVKLVRASSPAGAIRHVTKPAYTAKVAEQNDLVAALQAGLKVEDAGADEPEPVGAAA